MSAEGPQVWTALGAPLYQGERVGLGLDFGVRFRDGMRNVFDRRVALGSSVKAGRGIKLLGAYMIRHKDYKGVHAVDSDHRLVGGMTYPMLGGGGRSLALSGTTLYERHIGQPGIEAFNRYRQQIEISQQRKHASPYLEEDFTFKREGFVRSRTRAGLLFPVRHDNTLGLIYQLSMKKRDHAWGPEHAVLVTFDLSRPWF